MNNNLFVNILTFPIYMNKIFFEQNYENRENQQKYFSIYVKRYFQKEFCVMSITQNDKNYSVQFQNRKFDRRIIIFITFIVL